MNNTLVIEDVKLKAKSKYPLHYHLMEINYKIYSAEEKGYTSSMYMDDIEGYVSITSRGRKMHV